MTEHRFGGRKEQTFTTVALLNLAIERRVETASSVRMATGVYEKPSTQDTSPLKASYHINDGKHHLLLAATGSVATIKIPNIVQALSKYDNLSIRVLLTESAAEFLQGQADEQPTLAQILAVKNVEAIYRDADEWRKPWVRGDSILHIELRRWADLMVIAPLSANSLAKVSLGMSDNLVSSVVRAWDATGIIDQARPGVPLPYGGRKGIIVAPAMNTAMWHHPVTAEHMRRLTTDWSVENGGWFEVLRPIEKALACGDTGSGAMHDWKLIVAAIEQRLQLRESDTAKTSTNGGLGQ
ncbi:hypothetical protein LTR56_022312 [Elasticomyces elasticus]|nr:hypothetical protein LTR56_022312 [Elasticomyces elasticus]KAK3637641.1 hypothetical protein LTR22_018204 [Elasticomyces elasticus]KAK4908711.1 hypothetical protein LTR49_022451 [Elasticomyces elasticus]KAK5748632.1 hypothetical protein LTS12_021334 [Elasticomyces elasticus]